MLITNDAFNSRVNIRDILNIFEIHLRAIKTLYIARLVLCLICYVFMRKIRNRPSKIKYYLWYGSIKRLTAMCKYVIVGCRIIEYNDYMVVWFLEISISIDVFIMKRGYNKWNTSKKKNIYPIIR